MKVDGTPPYGFQWFKNGFAISGANEFSYTTPPVSPSDDGAQFSVKISNEFSEQLSGIAQLHVNSANTPPTISSIPDQIVNEDSPSAAIPFSFKRLAQYVTSSG